MKYANFFSILTLMLASVFTANGMGTGAVMTGSMMTGTVMTGTIEEDFGGRASSIEGNIAPSSLLTSEEILSEEQTDDDSNENDLGGDDASNTNGLGDNDQSGDNDSGQDDIEAIVEAVIDDSIMECNEEQYIIARRTMLQAQSYEVVYLIPQYYIVLLGENTIAEINAQVQSMKLLSPIERNAMIQSIVCKIEAAKEARNVKYSNIGAPASGNASEYLSQYLQDMVILGYVGN